MTSKTPHLDAAINRVTIPGEAPNRNISHPLSEPEYWSVYHRNGWTLEIVTAFGYVYPSKRGYVHAKTWYEVRAKAAIKYKYPQEVLILIHPDFPNAEALPL